MSGVVVEQRFAQWLQMAGLDRLDLEALARYALRSSDQDPEKAELLRTVVLWLQGRGTAGTVPSLVLDFMDEYAAAASRAADELRLATNTLIASAEPGERSGVPRRRARLTDREHEVLALLAHALSNRLIAVRLSISEKTVKNHITSVFAKLGVSSRSEALVVALHEGVLEDRGPDRAESRVGGS
ncbi:helix-turn-helix domain-containing protein [Saccharothrix sp. Mg75]|uniref:helix-turn-helix transcriptional regulator n=1 Tax=Saccharothrix sp. Mg75 TaxID=3445357 RepID=UPI003EEDFFFC